MDIRQESLAKHYEWAGKIEVTARTHAKSRKELSLAYTPGVAEPCVVIQKNPEEVWKLTRRWNTVAVITDGTAVLGLGDIGPEAGMPVMEGKCLLFKEFAGIDAIPLCIRSKDPDEIVNTVRLLCGSFGGVNLEDISAPRCFEIERRLRECCDIPVFHDDQHGTAIIVSAAMLNACRVVKKDISEISVVINGAGAAGLSIGKMLRRIGVTDLTYVDKNGVLYEGREDMNPAQAAEVVGTNKAGIRGYLADAVKGKDAFVGVSAANVLSEDMVRSMAAGPIIFAMANPNPEIMPDKAKAAGAAVVGTGRSDFPNQINNVLAFPGIFRGALDARASDITEEMKVAAARALSAIVTDEELNDEYIIPDAFDPRVCPAVSQAVFKCAKGIE
ncbi:MAG: NAD-dependent malic enzyme [Ruminococcus sp.]|nr:NAD-dependent malic enzyme [Ruminococcus sp.]